MKTANFINKKVSRQLKKIVNRELERLVLLAQKQGDPMKDDNIAGYIVGAQQMAANLNVLVGNVVGENESCWRCGNALETEEGKDHSGDPVKICCECGAIIR